MTNEELIEAIKNSPQNKSDYMAILYKQNKGLIYKAALKFKEKADIEDLMQEAYLFLDEAANSYEGKYEAKFSTYFSHMLSWRLAAYVFSNSSTVRIPRHLNDIIKRYKFFIQQFYQKNGYEAKEADIMRALNLSEKEFSGLINAVRSLEIASLDSPAPFEESLTLADIIASEEDFTEEIEEESEKNFKSSEIKKALGKLRVNERTVIDRFYFHGDTLEKVAADINVSPSYCSTIKQQALRNLRKDSELIKAVTNYDSYADYHYSVKRFKNTRISSVEFTAIRNEEAAERYRKIYERLYHIKYAV